MELSFPWRKSEMIYLLTADDIHTTLLDVEKGEFLAADVIDYIW